MQRCAVTCLRQVQLLGDAQQLPSAFGRAALVEKLVPAKALYGTKVTTISNESSKRLRTAIMDCCSGRRNAMRSSDIALTVLLPGCRSDPFQVVRFKCR